MPVSQLSGEQDIKSLSKAAFALLDELHLAPTPANYELVYTHMTGTNLALSTSIDQLLAEDAGISETTAANLHAQFFDDTCNAQALLTSAARVQALLEQLSEAATALGDGAAGYNSALDAASQKMRAGLDSKALRAIIGQLIDETRQMQTRTLDLERSVYDSNQKIADLRSNLEKAHNAALTDSLTGLANRKKFDVVMPVLTREAIRKAEKLSMIVIDIDHFKSFNDRFGHQVGDNVLRLVAAILQRNIKGRDLAVRLGGEEFVLLLPKTDAHGAQRLAEDLREIVSKRQFRDRRTGQLLGRITISAGISEYAFGEDTQTFFGRADMAMYEAKHSGRNKVVIRERQEESLREFVKVDNGTSHAVR